MIIKLMAEWGAVSFGFSYDINISRLSIVSNFKGGTEVFVRYDLDKFSRKKIRVKYVNNKWLCDLCVEEEITYNDRLSIEAKVLCIDLGF